MTIWRIENRDRINELKRACRARHPGREATYSRRAKEKNPWIYSFYTTKVRSKKRGIKFTLSRTYFERLWTGKCELTHIKFRLMKGRLNPFAPSIDRIDPKKGYVDGNVRFILFGLNALKSNGTDTDMRTIAQALVDTF
jgi:hypothetical protein